MEFDPFVAGLRAYFAQNPKEKPSTVSLRAGLDASVIRKMTGKPGHSPKVSTATKIAKALGLSVEDVIGYGSHASQPRLTVIAGAVGAGDCVQLAEVYPDGGGPEVVTPPGLNADVVAVEVQGDSMEPVYSDGDLLFYSRPSADGVPSEAVGRRCICADAEGLAWVKVVKPGEAPGVFHLISLNPTAINRFNVVLKWAAPVRLHWPKELSVKTA